MNSAQGLNPLRASTMATDIWYCDNISSNGKIQLNSVSLKHSLSLTHTQTHCDDVIVTTDEYVLWPPCHWAWLFGVGVRVHVWNPVDPGSSPGGFWCRWLLSSPSNTSALCLFTSLVSGVKAKGKLIRSAKLSIASVDGSGMKPTDHAVKVCSVPVTYIFLGSL